MDDLSDDNKFFKTSKAYTQMYRYICTIKKTQPNRSKIFNEALDFKRTSSFNKVQKITCIILFATKKRDDLKSKYNSYKKRLENLKELAKRKYFSNKIEKCKGKSQVLWKND